ncbi:MAG: FkbM family methyltransferase [Sphingomonadales bacterium]|nr:FkbM family methyltransferase [Sphingomonadales bacterium]
MNLKSILRSTQSAFPFIRPWKFEAYNFGTRHFGWHVEAEFRLLAGLAPVSLALDIGGNWGQSIHALQRLARPGRIISFEPNPVLAARLQRRFAGDAAVEIRNFALSNAAGEFTLHVPRYGNYLYDGLASLKVEEARDWFTPERFAWFNPARLHIDSAIVTTATLDSLALSPAVVKIDVQGAEELVVEGGLATFDRCKPFTIMECPTARIVEQLSGVGLQAYHYHQGKLQHWEHHDSNVVFMTDAHRATLGL